MTRIQDFSPRTTPLPHQIEAIDYVEGEPNAAVFDEQGLGKTKIIIESASRLMARGEIDAVLVVAPKSLIFTWEQEVHKHSFLIPVVLHGQGRKRRYQFMTGANFYICNYESVVSQLAVFRKLCKSRKMCLVLDESTRIKDPKTRIASSLFELSPLAARRVIMTGTPVANRPGDIWSQFYFLDCGALLGSDFESFGARFDQQAGDFQEQLALLSEQVRSHSIRRLKSEVLQLPDKSYITHKVVLEPQQRRMYDLCADELLLELRSMSGEIFRREVPNVLERLLRLVQIASDPTLVDARFAGESGKLKLMRELVPSLLDVHEKIIIWSSFVGNVETLARTFSQHGTVVIHGGVRAEERAQIVETIQNDATSRILVANPAAAREGLTLTRASAAVYFDRSFSLIDYLQSQDRIHRIGQVRECEIHKLVGEDTVDEYVDTIIALKQSVGEFVYMPSLESGQQIVDLLEDKEQIMHMLGGESS